MVCDMLKNDMKFKFSRPRIKFYWDTATLTHLYMVHVCFRAKTAALRGHRGQGTRKA